MSVTLVVLTMNRLNVAREALSHSYGNAGAAIDEVVWVDNGSTVPDPREYCPFAMRTNSKVTYVLNPTNRGVATGLNQGFSMVRTDYAAIIGCDRLMPDGWLRVWLDVFANVGDCGAVATYTVGLEDVPERIQGDEVTIAGHRLRPVMPIGARIIRRTTLRRIGYFDEALNPYGWEDVVWGHRATKVMAERRLRSYTPLDLGVAKHLGEQDDPAYMKWKRELAHDPRRMQHVEEKLQDGWPRYDPWAAE